MKMLHAIQGVERSSGASLFVVELLKGLVAKGHLCTLLYSTVCEVEDLLPPSVKVVRSDVVTHILAEGRYDLVHMHGIWSLFNRNVMMDCCAANVPYVVSPHGCLMPRALRKGMLKKCVFYLLFLRALMRKAALVHVTTEAERRACWRVGLTNKMAVIPLGVHLGEALDVPKEKIVLTLSRISPEKGIDDLLRAWHQIDHSGWRFIIAGPSWRGYREKLERMVIDQGIKGVEFTGPVYDVDKRQLYARASLFVMASNTENFGGTVLEALAEQTPVVTTTDVDWQEVANEGCGWRCSRADLSNVLREAMNISETCSKKMGSMGLDFAKKYDWEIIGNKMEKSYFESLGHC